MADIEKIIRGLECCCEHIVGMNCDKCPYDSEQYEIGNINQCTASLAYDALELLKEKDNPWRFFKFRKATEEEKEYYKVEYGEYNEGDADELEMIENVPGDGEEVLLWTGYGFSVDTYDDGMFEGAGEVEKGMAWRYLPEPPKEDETH